MMGRMILKATTVLCLWAVAVPIWGNEQPSKEKGTKGRSAKMDKDSYVIGPGDILEVSVWKDETLDTVVTVLPDGYFFFPVIGGVAAGGKTVSELKKEIEDKICPYVPDPTVSIVIQKVESLLIYVIGRVNHPGHFVLNTNVNVMQALSMAEGLNEFAKRRDIKIFREKGYTTEIFRFNYDDVSQGINLDQNIQLKRGDVIVVP